MIGRNWVWGDIVNPRLVDQAIADEKRRAERRAKDAPATNDRENDHRPVAA